MDLNPPQTLAELAVRAREIIVSRLSDLGSPDLAFEVKVVGDDNTTITSVCPIESIRPGCLTFATAKDYLDQVEKTEAAAVILPSGLSPADKPALQAPEPRLVFSVIMELTMAPPSLVPAEPSLIRFKDRSRVSIGRGTIVGDFCYLGAEVSIGSNCLIYPQVFIDDQVTIGDDCIIYPGVTIFRRTTLGRRVIVHAGAVLGDDGFGYNQIIDLNRDRIHHLKNKHAGSLQLEDFVEVGSQTCIDRGLAGPTVIGAGTKIDNQVQIAHNVRIGRDCIILAQVGLAGSARVGDRAFLLGQAGVKDNVNIGPDAVISSMTGVHSDVPSGRTVWAGRPVQKADQEWRQKAMVKKDLPRLRDFWRILKKADSFEDLKRRFFHKNR